MIERLRTLPARTPLRVRLVAALLALAALALLVTGIAGAAALRGYLVQRVDGQLPAVMEIVMRPGRGSHDEPYDPVTALYAQRTNREGNVVAVEVHGGQAAPVLPRLDLAAATDRAGTPFTVPAKGGRGSWRVLVRTLPDDSSVAVALSLGDVDATVARLAVIELVVSLLVLTLLAGLAHAVVRHSLQPLVQVERTAAAIAAGDLSRRVPERDPRTEVGRLSRALNAMLAQIEAAFRDRAASEAAARRSEDRMRRFIADASHELRTPLTSIRGFAELYRQGAVTDPADAARLLRRIEDEAKRMGLLVDDLLLLARLDQQRPLERHPVDLLALAADAVHDARVVAPDRRIDLRVLESSAGAGADEEVAPVVIGDEARLRQVVGNLVANALTHTPAGTPVTVAVGSDAGPAGVREAVLEVRDAGPGLAPEEAGRVFERFYRADASRTRAQGGSGLGLSIVAALVAAHGGTVDVLSAPGAGATFRVRLPLAPSAGALPPVERPELPASPEPAARLLTGSGPILRAEPGG